MQTYTHIGKYMPPVVAWNRNSRKQNNLSEQWRQIKVETKECNNNKDNSNDNY